MKKSKSTIHKAEKKSPPKPSARAALNKFEGDAWIGHLDKTFEAMPRFYPPGVRFWHPSGDWFVPANSKDGCYSSSAFVRTAEQLHSEGWLYQNPGARGFFPCVSFE